jgi:DNA topoisomerase VI subunit B
MTISLSKRTIAARVGRVASAASVQQAKNPAETPQFLQVVAKPKRAAGGKPEPKLTRVAFKVSRLMEFCSERELVNQTGHSVYEWPLVVAKETMDNALDAAEETEVAPEITVCVEPGAITIEDNAAGIDAETIESVLDYTVRVSSREAYVSPTRGAQGNAIKTILAMGYVLDRGNGGDRAGVTIIESRGVRHQIEFRVDHINNQPKIVHTTAASPVEAGTRLTINWPSKLDLLEDAEAEFQELIEAYVWFNPHLSLRGVWFGREFINVKATNPAFEKWRPRNPTSAHWYDETRLQRYLAAHVARDRDLGQRRTVREFIAEFRGLSGTAAQRQILTEVGCSHQSLAHFFGADQVNRVGVAKLLTAMKSRSKPVNPARLGIIGADHLKQRFLAAGGNPDTFKYQQRKGMSGRHPLRRRVRLRAASIRPGARRRLRNPQIRDRSQLQRRD